MLNVLGGGMEFKPGAKLKMFESGGYVGQSLQAPVFTPSSTTVINQNNSESLEAIKKLAGALQEQAKAVQEVSRQVREIQVVQVTSTVTNAQQKQVRQKSIGTI